jgi:hypothetical protein
MSNWPENGVFTAMAALNAVDACGALAAPAFKAIAGLPTEGPVPHERYKTYLPRLLNTAR